MKSRLGLLCVFLMNVLFGSVQVNDKILRHLKTVRDKGTGHSMRNIDFIYMINLDKATDRWKRSSELLNQYGIYPYRFSGVNGWKLPIQAMIDIGVEYEEWMQLGMDKEVRRRGKFWREQGIKGYAGTYYTYDHGLANDWGQVHGTINQPGQSYFVHSMSPGQIGCALSHISVLQDAYDSGYEVVWILEDDIDVNEDPNILSDLIDELELRLQSSKGKHSWDILFTDVNYKDNNTGEYVVCGDCSFRINYYSRNRFGREKQITPNIKLIGARFGAHSYIVRRQGIEKLLKFFHQYMIFDPYDIDMLRPNGIRMFGLTRDVVSQQVGSSSNTSSPL